MVDIFEYNLPLTYAVICFIFGGKMNLHEKSFENFSHEILHKSNIL